MPKIKNILIFTSIAAVFALIFFYFIRSSTGPEQSNLVSLPVSTTTDTNVSAGSVPVSSPVVAKDFLTLLLSVKNIKLDDSVLSDPAFSNLHDSSIVLVPDGNEGRPNPFAQFGNDNIITPPVTQTQTPPPTSTSSSSSNPSTSTPANP